MAVRKINVSSGSLFITLLIAGFILLWLPQSFTCHLNFLFVRVFDPLLRLGRHVEIEAAQSYTLQFSHLLYWISRFDFRT